MLAMFSSSLRGRSIWRKLGPAITGSTIASFQESPMTSIDLSLPVHGTVKQATLHVLLLEAGDLMTGKAASRLEGLYSAVRRSSALKAVILVHDHTDTNMRLCNVMQLQNMFVLADFSGSSDINRRLLEYGRPMCLYASLVEKVMDILQDFVSRLTESTLANPLQPPHCAQLIAHATATAPNRLLSKGDTYLLSDLFASIGELEKSTRTEEGRRKIRDFLDAGTARDVIDFWEDEWIA